MPIAPSLEGAIYTPPHSSPKANPDDSLTTQTHQPISTTIAFVLKIGSPPPSSSSPPSAKPYNDHTDSSTARSSPPSFSALIPYPLSLIPFNFHHPPFYLSPNPFPRPFFR